MKIYNFVPSEFLYIFVKVFRLVYIFVIVFSGDLRSIKKIPRQ